MSCLQHRRKQRLTDFDCFSLRMGCCNPLSATMLLFFISAEFKRFFQENGIHHITGAPYHPSTNGLAERAVQSFKQGIKRISDWSQVSFSVLHNTAFCYGNLPCSTFAGLDPEVTFEFVVPRRQCTCTATSGKAEMTPQPSHQEA